MTKPIYAIGDIHGQLEMLRQALALIDADGGQDARVVFLGDYVDRGPNSRGVVQLLMDGVAQGRNWNCILGNHDRMFTMFMEDYPRQDKQLLVGYHWLHEKLGGVETLASYGVEVAEGMRTFEVHAVAKEQVPDSHIEFLRGLATSYETDELLFVHAGIVPGVPLCEQRDNDLIWIRGPFLNDERPHPWLVVHGHTPVKAAEHQGNRVNLDSGAGYGRPLSVARFDGTECTLLTESGPVPLLR
ncbi:MAG: metallophosphoesterase family protein [Paracoccaceae bacterium]